MLEGGGSGDGSALVTSKGPMDGSASTSSKGPVKGSSSGRPPIKAGRDDRWCSYCKKTGLTKETCFRLHGKGRFLSKLEGSKSLHNDVKSGPTLMEDDRDPGPMKNTKMDVLGSNTNEEENPTWSSNNSNCPNQR
ncbi:hypothetical protein SESBI_30994 [Sesbania bispinosa]|nr:hypothetical protein SESBI_30994 [Sesbania bispinosa]